jgi:hypothetical protein
MSAVEEDGWIVYRMSALRFAVFLMLGIGCILCGLYCLDLARLKMKFAGYVFLVLGPILILKCLMLLTAGMVVFKYNAERLSVSGMLGTRSLWWTEISNVGIMEHSQYAVGFIKINSTQSLYVQPISGWKLYVPTNWVGLSNNEMLELGGIFNSLRAKHQHLNSFAPANDSKNDYADTVVARYLARKAEEQNLSPAPQSFHTASPAPANAPVTFGKRRSFP